MGPARGDIHSWHRYPVSGATQQLLRFINENIKIVRAIHGRRDLDGPFDLSRPEVLQRPRPPIALNHHPAINPALTFSAAR